MPAAEPVSPERRRTWWILGAILCLGLALRLIALMMFPTLTFPDTTTYLKAGAELFAGEHVGNHVYMPLYPVVTYLLGGDLGLKLGEIALSTATIVLVFLLAEHLSRATSVGLVAALLTALYPFLVFFAVARMTETLYVFLTCAAFLALYKHRFASGVLLLVLAILTKPTIDYLAPLLILTFSLLVFREGWRQGARHVATYAVVYLVLLTPWWIHNYTKYGEFVRLSLGDGIVLYSGNNPLNESGGGVAWPNRGGPVDMDVDQFDKITDPIARNQAMKDAAVTYIQENPGRFIELAGLKFLRFWRLWPYADEYTKPIFVIASVLSFGPVLLLAVLSLFLVVPRAWRTLAPILLYIAYLTAVHMVTIGSVRYRIPLAPFLITLAAMSAVVLLQRWQPTADLLRRHGFAPFVPGERGTDEGGGR